MCSSNNHGVCVYWRPALCVCLSDWRLLLEAGLVRRRMCICVHICIFPTSDLFYKRQEKAILCMCVSLTSEDRSCKKDVYVCVCLGMFLQ